MKDKIKPSDITTLIGGFCCDKIKHLPDNKLMDLEDEISKNVKSVSYSNTEEYRSLHVCWVGSHTSTSDKEIIEICKILNRYYKS